MIETKSSSSSAGSIAGQGEKDLNQPISKEVSALDSDRSIDASASQPVQSSSKADVTLTDVWLDVRKKEQRKKKGKRE